VTEPARILVVDDDADLLRLTSILLKKAGYEVLEATTGANALRLARELEPDLVLLDVMLPDINGLEVCRQIKADAHRGGSFVVFLSAFQTKPDDHADGLEAGADSYITRPIANRELLARVQAMLRHKRAEDMLRERTHQLGERVKELNCLYGISQLVETSGISLDEILQGTVELIPPSWQYPKITCARIIVEDQGFKTDNFQETPWCQTQDIKVHGNRAGGVDVFYLEERPASDEGPFLKEERSLVNAIAAQLGRIVERVRAEEAMRASEEKYRDLVEKVSDVIYTLDAGGTITYVSPAIESCLGYSPSEVVGRPVCDLIAPEDAQRQSNNLQRLVSGESLDPNEYRVVTKSGEVRWITTSSQPILKGDQVTGVRGVLSDITDRKIAQEELEESAVGAERERLARELHDAVTQALFSASLIADTMPRVWERDPEEGRRGLEEIYRLTHGALAEMRNLLFELRPDALGEQDLGVLLGQLTAGMMARTRTSFKTTVEGEPSLPSEVRVALYRIAQESLNNITKHAHAKEATVSLYNELNRVTLRICDDGQGFDLDGVQPERLGLRIMRERAQAIGGTFSIKSQPAQGTEVTVVWSDGEENQKPGDVPGS
jgi:PAS domain S-box-containing protein